MSSNETPENNLDETEVNVPEVNEENLGYDELLDKLEQAEDLAKKSEAKMLRFQADVENIQKRAQKDVQNAHRFALEKFVGEFLPVFDSLEQALKAAANKDDTSEEPIKEGIRLTLKMLQEVLSRYHISTITPEVGDIFDHSLHEAMSMQPSDEVPENGILLVVQTGYKLHDRLIRPARVIVAAAKTDG